MSQKIVFLFLIAGCILTFIGYREHILSKGTKPDPTLIDLAKMEEKQAALENNYVKIGAHWRGYPYAIFAYKSNSNINDAHRKTRVVYTYFPIISEKHPFIIQMIKLGKQYGGFEKIPGSEMPSINSFVILIKTEKYRRVEKIPTEWELKDETEGLIVNRIKKLTFDETRLIKSEFPDIDTDSILLLGEDRKPLNKFVKFGILGSGILLFTISIGTLLFGRISDEYEHV